MKQKFNTFDNFVPTPKTKKELKEIAKNNNGLIPVDYSKIWQADCIYNLIWGERSNGKTFGALEAMIEKYFVTGRTFAYVRRWADEITLRQLNDLIRPLNIAGVVERLSDGRYEKIVVKNKKFWLANHDDKTDTDVLDEEPIGHAMALNTWEHDKGGSDPRLGTIHFDEFMTRSGYLKDEFVDFCHVVSTLKRKKTDVKILMTANSVNRKNPYFDEMGLTDGKNSVYKMKPGDVQLWQQGEIGPSILCVMTDSQIDDEFRKEDAYFSFNNPQLKMIQSGEWELAQYPHCPCDILPKDIVCTFFIDFDTQLLQCEIVSTDDGNYFCFIHEKTTPLKNPNCDIIFSDKIDPRPNWSNNILRPTNNIMKKIASFFVSGNWFVSTNEIGEIVNNYIQYCKKI